MPRHAGGRPRPATAAAAAPATSGGAAPRRRSDGAPRRNPELEQALLRLDELLRHPPLEDLASSRTQHAERSRIEQHRAALLASASEPVDRQVIELVTRLFESLLADSQLPARFGRVLARMQVAALRVVPGRARGARFVRASGLAPARPHRRGRAWATRASRIRACRASCAFASAVAEEMAGGAAPDTALFRRGLNRIDVFLSEQLQAPAARRAGRRSMRCSSPSGARSCSST